ncbi:capsular biosynthesis protein [Vulcanibacillus modesticaldus]|uniref:Capsular biosynthesis protein n=1 Tax=Vulcanibacillus modesticaldus TaxID=337097 RepID=A0A1D2YVX9_9BACI|nr:Wzz/FepE/Etk N-terminal domain-containing protein [Vulcanibacillus modesticaldus]OEF99797.1 capsular biosynthesis protein [Vulcanibacillus modesticaldus]
MEEIRRNEDVEIDLRELLQIIKKRLGMILVIVLVATLVSGIISFFFLTPIYQASTELLVNKSDQDMNSIYSYSDIQTNLKLIETYNVIIKSPRIIDLVIANYNLDLTAQELINKISVNTVKNSQVMSITVTDPDYTKAVMLANAIADTFEKEIVNIMKVDNVQILTKAKAVQNPAPIKPKPMLNIMIALVLSLMLGIGLTFLLEYLDNSIRSEADIERLLGYPVLGSISTFEISKEKHKIVRQVNGTLQKRGEVREI